MNIVITGGSGQIGGVLARAWAARGDKVTVIGRSTTPAWDGKTLGPWAAALDGADIVVNLAGRTVNCRYTEDNLRQMMESRVDSTKVVGEAIAAAKAPPRVWLQMSTATIYAHRFDAANDELTGIIGGSEPDVPAYWKRSVDIARAWEATLAAAATPKTRKIAMRTTMLMSPDREGIFDVLLKLVRRRLGGTVGSGAQYVSWIHDQDFVRAVDFVIGRDDLDGAINFAGPGPLPQKDMMAAMRDAWGTRIGLPATKWMAELGAWALRTDTELLLKSRRVVPKRLLDAGFTFHHPAWPEAATDLVTRWRANA